MVRFLNLGNDGNFPFIPDKNVDILSPDAHLNRFEMMGGGDVNH